MERSEQGDAGKVIDQETLDDIKGLITAEYPSLWRVPANYNTERLASLILGRLGYGVPEPPGKPQRIATGLYLDHVDEHSGRLIGDFNGELLAIAEIYKHENYMIYTNHCKLFLAAPELVDALYGLCYCLQPPYFSNPKFLEDLGENAELSKYYCDAINILKTLGRVESPPRVSG